MTARDLAREVLIVALVGVLAWCLVQDGATEPHRLRELFLVLATLSAVLALDWPIRRQPRAAQADAVVICIGIWLLARVAWGPTSQIALGYTHAAVGWMSFFIADRLTASSRSMPGRHLALLLVLVGVLEAWLGLAQTAGTAILPSLGQPSPGAMASGTLINHNHFAGLINMTLGLAAGGLVAGLADGHDTSRRRSEIHARAWIVVLVCSLLGLSVVLSHSRGGLLAMLIMLVFVSVLLTVSRRRGEVRSGWAAVLLLVTVLLLGLAFGLETLGERIVTADEIGRGALYMDTLRLIADHPLGVGPGHFRFRFRPYQTTQSEVHFDHAHNDYLEVAADWGLPVAIVFWCFVGLRLWTALAASLGIGDRRLRALAIGTAAALVSILVHSLVDFNLHIPGNLMVFAMVLALAGNLQNKRQPTWNHRRSLLVPFTVLLIICLALASWRVQRRLAASELAASASWSASPAVRAK